MEPLTKVLTCKLWEIIEKYQTTPCNNWLLSLKSKQISEDSWPERRLEECSIMPVWVDTTMKTVNKTMIMKKFSKSEMSSVNSIMMKRPTMEIALLTIDQCLSLKIMPNMMESGSPEKTSDKVKEDKFGQMVQCMKVGGKIIKPMEKEDLFMPMEMFMMANGSMIKPTDLVSIAI